MADNAKAELVIFESALPITKNDLDNERERNRILKEFVRSQMVDEIDHGVIPGTHARSLYQPGAQKLAKLFGLGTRILASDKNIDLHQNFAMFSYTIEVYHLRTGQSIAQCEGSANSHEKKNRNQRVDGALQERPIGDLMNTLMKMAQKRAMVGAIIQATGASDFYTQDIEDTDDAKALGIRQEPRRAQAVVPTATSAKSTDEGSTPQCCGKSMMVSKYHTDSWYCLKCKTTLPFEGK